MKLLVTGGTGFFGRALLRSWLRDEVSGVRVPEVTIVTRSPNSFVERYSMPICTSDICWARLVTLKSAFFISMECCLLWKYRSNNCICRELYSRSSTFENSKTNAYE